ncbi:HYC_CC_PP family protein [Flavobacteriaceae bacterium M23B6Z8]
MRKLFSKIIAVTLTCVVLFSTVSFSVGKHFCGNVLVDVSIFKEAASCGMEMNSATASGCEITKMNCCKDVQIVIEGQENLKDTSVQNSVTPVQIYAIAGFVYESLKIDEPEADKVIILEKYIPPLLLRDLLVQHQTFLI